LWASGRFTIRARSRTTRSSTETPPTNTCAHLSVVSAKFLSSTDGWWRLGPVCYPRGQPRQTRTLDRPSACGRGVPPPSRSRDTCGARVASRRAFQNARNMRRHGWKEPAAGVPPAVPPAAAGRDRADAADSAG
jgi:hypothetical protein